MNLKNIKIGNLVVLSAASPVANLDETKLKKAHETINELAQKYAAENYDYEKSLNYYSAAIRKKITQSAGEATGVFKWGFDLTSFENPADFVKILKAVGIAPKSKKVSLNGVPAFLWEAKDIKIITANDPITGQYSDPKRRDPEVGYASYIGIEGEEEKVKMVAKMIKQLGDIKDESPGRRDFI